MRPDASKTKGELTFLETAPSDAFLGAVRAPFGAARSPFGAVGDLFCYRSGPFVEPLVHLLTLEVPISAPLGTVSGTAGMTF